MWRPRSLRPLAAPGLLWILQTKTAQEVTRDPQDKLEQPRVRDNQRDTPLVYTHLQKKTLRLTLVRSQKCNCKDTGALLATWDNKAKKRLRRQMMITKHQPQLLTSWMQMVNRNVIILSCPLLEYLIICSSACALAASVREQIWSALERRLARHH